jgi:hypothetical protein
MNDQSRPTRTRRFPSDDRLIVGRLESHGAANYQFRADQRPSYYLKVVTNRGVEVLWGKDLARALAESRAQPKIGSVIGVRRTGYETFTIQERRRDEAGGLTDTQRLVRRNQWIVESPEFFTNRARLARRVRDAQEDARSAVKNHPELASTYLSLRGAQEIAERRIADPKDRERFLKLVREAMAKSIKNGDPLPAVRIRDRPNLERPENPLSPVRGSKREQGPVR